MTELRETNPTETITKAVSQVAAKAGFPAARKKPTKSVASADGKSGTDGNTPAEKPHGNSPPGQAAANSQNQKSAAIALTVDIGWTMAVLLGELQDPMVNDGPPDRLPTEHELPPEDRIELEQERIKALLAQLATLFSAIHVPVPATPTVTLNAQPGPEQAAGTDATQKSGQDILTDDNLVILKWLACAGREFGVAYQLGRSLRDTAKPPLRPDPGALTAGQQEIDARAAVLRSSPVWQAQQDRKKLAAGKGPAIQDEQAASEDQAKRDFFGRDALCKQLSRSRVSRIQEWLSTLMPYLPSDSAAIVSASIGRWSDVTTTIFDKNSPGGLRRFKGQSELDVSAELIKCLLPQGDAWINLLVGAESSAGLLTPEGCVVAGEAALGRTARIIKRIAAHYWFLLLILVIAVAAALYFAARDIDGAGKVWTQIATVAGAAGITAKGISNSMAKLSADAERPIYGLEKIDAMAWSVTTIPDQLKLSIRGVKALRRSGITPPGPMSQS
jgi:hypothetical protein